MLASNASQVDANQVDVNQVGAEFVSENQTNSAISSDAPPPTRELTSQTTLRDAIDSIPAVCFTKNLWRAWGGLALSVTAVVLGYVTIALAPWYLLPIAWIFTGTALTGFFVLGHDCGHRSFSRSLRVNDIVGHLMFLPLLYPFHPWRIKHDHHHTHTNKLGEDNAWYPFTAEGYTQISPFERFFYRLIRGKFWWIGSIIHWGALHFNASLYPEKQRSQVRFSAGLVIAFAAIAFPLMFLTIGLWGWVSFFLMPWMVYHFWMSTFTIVHHTMPDIQFHYPETWHAATDQLTGTVHCDYPAWVEFLCHDINWHIPHHVSTGIPFYHLRAAQASLDANWGKYLYKTRFSWDLMNKIGEKCHIFDEKNCYQSFREAGLL